MLTLRKVAAPIFCCLLLPGCSGSAPASATTPTAEAASNGLPEVCTDQRVRCEELTSKNVAIIYPYQGKAKKRGVLFWDAGGPGQAPLDGGATRQALPHWTKPFDLVALTEPWTYLPADPGCDSALMAAGVTGLTADENPDLSTCDWDTWSLDPSEIEAASTEIENLAGEISGVYAQSFGSIRSYPVMERVARRGGFVVLDSPAPTTEVAGSRLLAGRWELALNSVSLVPRCPWRCVSERRDELDRFLSGTEQLDTTEAGLGLVGVAPNLAENTQFMRGFWGESADLSRSELLSWKQSAHSFNRSNSANEPSSDLVSYISSICTAYGGWPTSPKNALEGMHAICSAPQFATAHASMAKIDGKMFLVVNDLDTVVPKDEQLTWRSKFTHVEIAHYRTRAHASAPSRIDASIANWLSRQ